MIYGFEQVTKGPLLRDGYPAIRALTTTVLEEVACFRMDFGRREKTFQLQGTNRVSGPQLPFTNGVMKLIAMHVGILFFHLDGTPEVY